MTKTELLNEKINESTRKRISELFDSLGISRTSLGRTLLSREIELYKVGVGARSVLYVGAHHALESITENILYAMLYDIALSPPTRNISGVNLGFLLQTFTFYIVPALNLDGIAIADGEGRDNILGERQRKICGGNFAVWQANARGVDLNHNYSVGFFEYKKLERELGIYAAPSKYSGEYPESEPEVRSLANLVRIISPSLVVSLHTQGSEVFFFPDTKKASRIATGLAGACGYRVSRPTGSEKYGGLCDYTGSLGIPSFTVEAGLGKNPLPISHAEPIYSRIGAPLITLPTRL